jgi:hypothetical protein
VDDHNRVKSRLLTLFLTFSLSRANAEESEGQQNQSKQHGT